MQPRSRGAFRLGGRAMLHRLPLAHRLLLIYLLSFVSVAVLAYSLVVEKNIAIDFTQKEQRGSAYVAVVRDALLATIVDRLAGVTSQIETRTANGAALQELAAAVAAAERRYGQGMGTAALADSLEELLRRLSAREEDDLVVRGALHMQAITAARQLISRIADQSNLILDPYLDSYY